MPKWFENTLRVSGEEAELRWFEQSATPERGSNTDALSLARLYPMPTELYPERVEPALLKALCNGRWDNWCLAHWGTKWEVLATRRYGEAGLLYHFVSADGAPVGWVVKVGRDFSLRFKLTYEAPGLSIRGVTVVDQGAILVDECQRYA